MTPHRSQPDSVLETASRSTDGVAETPNDHLEEEFNLPDIQGGRQSEKSAAEQAYVTVEDLGPDLLADPPVSQDRATQINKRGPREPTDLSVSQTDVPRDQCNLPPSVSGRTLRSSTVRQRENTLRGERSKKTATERRTYTVPEERVERPPAQSLCEAAEPDCVEASAEHEGTTDTEGSPLVNLADEIVADTSEGGETASNVIGGAARLPRDIHEEAFNLSVPFLSETVATSPVAEAIAGTPSEERAMYAHPSTSETNQAQSAEHETWRTKLIQAIHAHDPATPLDLFLVQTGLGPSNAQAQAFVDDHFISNTQSKLQSRTKQPGSQQGRPRPTTAVAGSRRAQRRRKYRLLQSTYERSRSQAARSVLSGDWDKEGPSETLGMREASGFWKPLFETSSVPDARNPDPIRDVQWDLIAPFTKSETQEALKAAADSASGPDGRTLRDLKQAPIDLLVAFFNVWLLAGCVPSQLLEGRTILIPKIAGSASPAEHRPITVSSILVRLFHKVLAKRLDQLCPSSLRQKAFKEGDGLYENVLILKSVLHDAKTPGRPRDLNLVFLDVRKAFDSVSHESLLAACKRAGMPEQLREYIGWIYRNGYTRLNVGGEQSEPIVAGQGVKQGDPLSCALFNLVIDWALEGIRSEFGYKLGNTSISHLAFADDLCLISSTSEGLQYNTNVVLQALARMGLHCNANKCSTLRLKTIPRTKQYLVSAEPFLTVGGQLLPILNEGELYKYLGIYFGAKGAVLQIQEKLSGWLSETCKAPLKPQQRLHILRQNILPKMTHQCVLSDCTLGALENFDRQVRKVVRVWLGIPQDTPTGYFHSSYRVGGLNISSLARDIPAMKVSRMEKLTMSVDPVVQAAMRMSWVASDFQKWNQALDKDWTDKQGSNFAATKEGRKSFWASELHRSVDGKGLKTAEKSTMGQWKTAVGNKWLSSGTTEIPGWKFRLMVGLRGSVLQTSQRAARALPRPPGAPVPLGPCEACYQVAPGRPHSASQSGRPQLEQRPDTLAHRLQDCTKTHGQRVKRHDYVLKILVQMLEKKGWTVVVEPNIRTQAGLRKPDVVIYRQGPISPEKWVIDVQIAADAGYYEDPDTPHYNKVNYYSSNPDVEEAVKNEFGPVLSARFSACVFSWRGFPAPASLRDMQLWGLSRCNIETLCQIVVEQGVKLYQVYRSNAYQLGSTLQSQLVAPNSQRPRLVNS